ncbi:hypothetical protein [Paratractidigestivibacter sp.]|uniref:hypothetical protein n=1 Tax=Paratractidigestivibacter sp. TaxID=2847316 RepID=UPI004028EC39
MSTKSVDIASGATPGKKGPGRFDDLSLEELVALLDEQDPAPAPARKRFRGRPAPTPATAPTPASDDNWSRICAEWGVDPEAKA